MTETPTVNLLFSVVLPLTVAAVLLASGLAKLRAPDTIDGWREMGVPQRLQRTWLLRFHPWGELALAGALSALGGVLGIAAATVALLLMIAYLVLVVRTYRTSPDAECACFGDRKPVTKLTIVRNVWYVALAAAALATIGSNPPWGGALASLPRLGWPVALAVLIAAITVALTMASPAVANPEPAPEHATQADAEPADYIRTRTPAIPITLGDGTETDLRTLTSQRPTILLGVTPGCGPCVNALAKLPEWRALLPEVDIRLLLTQSPDESPLTEPSDPQSVHDEKRYIRESLGAKRTPSATLLGADGLLAGGPVAGIDLVEGFMADVYESLHGEPPPTS